MGRKYKKKFETEWSGKTTSDVKIKTLQMRADRNISNLCKCGLGTKRRRYK